MPGLRIPRVPSMQTLLPSRGSLSGPRERGVAHPFPSLAPATARPHYSIATKHQHDEHDHFHVPSAMGRSADTTTTTTGTSASTATIASCVQSTTRAPRERLAGALPRGAVALPPQNLQSRYESDASPRRRMWRCQRGSSEPSVSRCAHGEGLSDDDEHCHGHENGAQQLRRAKRRSATATPTTMATRVRTTTIDSCAYAFNSQGNWYLGAYRYSSKNPRSLGQVQ